MTLATTMTDEARNAALLKAIGFDRLAPEQRELALGIANRYHLDPMLKHLVMIEGRPYITRDGLLHVAHKDGALDGIVTTEPVLTEGFWRSTCSVYRKDMSHPFTYTGRYPETGKNKAFAPEMAVKVGEVMALRRAFDVAAPTAEERWDVPDTADVATPPQPVSLADRVAQKAEAVKDPKVFGQMYEGMPLSPEPETPPEPVERTETAEDGPTLEEFASMVSDLPKPVVRDAVKALFPDVTRYADLTPAQLQAVLDLLVTDPPEEPQAELLEKVQTAVEDPTSVAYCGAPSPLSDATCTLDKGHPGRVHRAGLKESWEDAPA